MWSAIAIDRKDCKLVHGQEVRFRTPEGKFKLVLAENGNKVLMELTERGSALRGISYERLDVPDTRDFNDPEIFESAPDEPE
ncbi:MAG: hypothetical protein J4432_03365 [DPANN group archaeon]|nr:hypothetical protein [DPANN group archaeon]